MPWPLGGTLKFITGQPAGLEPLKGNVSGMAAFRGPNGLHVIVTIDNTFKFGALLHTSISHHKRDPYWHEIKAMREAFFPPDVDAMIMLPRASDYVNLHEHAFHVVQCPTEWGMR